ncbi:MAG: hypothetical protein H7Z17_19035, partial [Fuerstia sp.]|nr:hypothetical protein [Fuerstiella sp.]
MSLAIFCAGCGGPTSAELLSEAQKLAAKGDVTKAKSLAASIPSQDKHWAEAQFVLAQFELSAGDQESAVVLLNSIPLDGSQLSLEAANILAEIQLQNCQISEVAKQLEYVVSLQPGEFETRSRLASILVVSGQRSRADTHLMKMLTQGRISLKDLVMLTQPER